MGGVRTALFNWLYARHHGGAFLLRVEDTDLERSTEESATGIVRDLEWLGLHWDEDIVWQSTRRELHLKEVDALIERGLAYRCYCTSEELAAMREEAMAAGRKNLYDRRWRNRTDWPENEAYTIRFKMPLEGTTTIDDLVLGPISVNNEELDDLVIVRSDGTPTYNFVVVCDDAHMRVSHVIRGQDHTTNTFRQVHIYDALNKPRPRFGHLPLVDGLSKRKGSASVLHYEELGFTREALINYIARLGWSHGDQEIFSVEELIALFDLPAVNKASGRYDETKMTWVNEQWIRRLSTEDLAARLAPYLKAHGHEVSGDDPRLAIIADALRERAQTLVEMAAGAAFVFSAPAEYDPRAVKKWMKAASRAPFSDLIEAFSDCSWDEDGVGAAIAAVIAKHEVGMGKIAQPIRVALTGGSVSPGVYATVLAVGRDEAVRRMQAAQSLFPSE